MCLRTPSSRLKGTVGLVKKKGEFSLNYNTFAAVKQKLTEKALSFLFQQVCPEKLSQWRGMDFIKNERTPQHLYPSISRNCYCERMIVHRKKTNF